eukprot:gene1549-1689_t
MKWLSSLSLFSLLLTLWSSHLLVVEGANRHDVEDVFFPVDCEKVAQAGDHVLLEYSVVLSNGTISHRVGAPNQFYHAILDRNDESPVISSLKGMCTNSTRRLRWRHASEVNTQPIFIPHQSFAVDGDESMSLDIRLVHITSSEDYEIFAALRQQNYSKVLELIDQHVGVNAYDEWAQTPLMIAVQLQRVDIVAALLNTRMPKVDVNAAKPSGVTALFYAIEKGTPSVVTALLRRGADPNAILHHEGSRGNTPLHHACLLEKPKQAELLLEYGARPDAINQYNITPLQMLPRDAVPSVKQLFKKMFEGAFTETRAIDTSSPRRDL